MENWTILVDESRGTVRVAHWTEKKRRDERRSDEWFRTRNEAEDAALELELCIAAYA